ncbi:MAG: hypothetical protein HKN81_11185 [Gammaproteobacteria bacterium]|nr:hypothetical protein [Gammaproteobacteria bacterium]NND37683.1 hypothetical protein [Gammaproteobacteria bacterium]
MPDASFSGGSGPVVLAVATAPERRGLEFVGTTAGHADRVDILQTGVGPLEADAIRGHLVEVQARGLVSIGTCGSLDPAAGRGTVMVPVALICTNGQCVPVDADWRSRIVRSLSPATDRHEGLLITVDRVLGTPEQKRRVREQSNATAVDMESATLQQAARLAGIPFVALRVVLDGAGEVIPASVASGVDRAGDATPLRLLRALCMRPADIPGLLRLASSLRVANAALERAIRNSAAELIDPRQRR